MSLPFTVLPCKICGTYECTSTELGHERPVLIALARAGKNPTACGIFCHPDSPWNTAYLLHDKLNRREIILHSAAIAVRKVAAYLADESVGAPAIREIVLKIDMKDFIAWYESEGEERRLTPRTAELLRDLDDAAALVGECGEYCPDVKFVKPVPFHGRQAANNLAMEALRHQYDSSFELPIR